MCAIDYHHFGHRLKQHYACFECRKTFKASNEHLLVKVLLPRGWRFDRVPRKVPCPQCGVIMACMGRLFRAPKMSKVKEWAKLAARYGGPDQHLGAPFNTPWRRDDRKRVKSAAVRSANGLGRNHRPLSMLHPGTTRRNSFLP